MRKPICLILGSCLMLLSLLCTSCKKGFEPITYGKDACAHCKMTIMDDRYASELVTDKGRAYKFDDVLCMKQYIADQQLQNKVNIFVEDYLRRVAEPLDASKAIYVKHDFFASPMNGNYAAFGTADEARRFTDSLRVTALSWENLK